MCLGHIRVDGIEVSFHHYRAQYAHRIDEMRRLAEPTSLEHFDLDIRRPKSLDECSVM